MKIAVCEDENKQQEHLSGLITQWNRQTGCMTDTDFYTSGDHFLDSWEAGKLYDIVFLDIHMSGLDGMKTARRIRQLDEKLLIVFLTSRIEYVLKGYEVNAWRYLIKPVHPSEFFVCLNKAKELADREQEFLIIRSDSRYLKVPYDRIIYIESFGHYIEIHTAEQSYQMRQGISRLDGTLPACFFRCHRSYLINLRYVTEVKEQQVLLGDTSVPFSSKKKGQLLELMNQYK